MRADEVGAAVRCLTHQRWRVGDVLGGEVGLFCDVLLIIMSSTHQGEEVTVVLMRSPQLGNALRDNQTTCTFCQ